MVFFRVREVQFIFIKALSSTTELGMQSHVKQCFSNFNMYMNHLEILLNAYCDSVYLGWGLRSHISNKLLDGTNSIGLGI